MQGIILTDDLPEGEMSGNQEEKRTCNESLFLVSTQWLASLCFGLTLAPEGSFTTTKFYRVIINDWHHFPCLFNTFRMIKFDLSSLI